MRKKIKKQTSTLNSNSKIPIRVLYKKVGQAPEVKIISDVNKLKKAIIQKNLDIIPYEKIFIIGHNKKSSSNMFPNVFLPLKRIMGDFIAVNIDEKERKFKSLSQDEIIWYTKDFINKEPRKSNNKTTKAKKSINVTDVYERGFEDNRQSTSINDQTLFSMLIHLNLMLATILKNNGDDKK